MSKLFTQYFTEVLTVRGSEFITHVREHLPKAEVTFKIFHHPFVVLTVVRHLKTFRRNPQ